MSHPLYPHGSYAPVSFSPDRQTQERVRVAPIENGRAGTTRTVDWAGYPTLLDREPDWHSAGVWRDEPVFSNRRRSDRDIREAFCGYCQAMLLVPQASWFERPSERSAAGEAVSAAMAFGFASEEIRRLGFGLYPSPAAVREHLRGVGFSDEEIRAAGLVHDASGRPRAELAGNLVVPLHDFPSGDRQPDYFNCLLVAIDRRDSSFASYRFLAESASSAAGAYGLRTALSRPGSRRGLVLVENVLDALLLQCRGFEQVAAIGGSGRDFAPRRWEALASAGVEMVTLAFRQDERHARSIRDALVNALRARRAPEVCVAGDFPGSEESLLGVMRRFGRDDLRRALANRILAFHAKDFGSPEDVCLATEQEESRRGKVIFEPHYRTAFRQHLADLIGALPAEYREVHLERLREVDEAIRAAAWERLRDLVSNGIGPWRCVGVGPSAHRDIPASEAQIQSVFSEWEQREREAADL